MKIERQKLFELVWSSPIYKLCHQFGISDRGLAKVCIRSNVPLPPHGYFFAPTNVNGRVNGLPQSACAPFHHVILEMLDANETLKTILARLRELGFKSSRNSVAAYVSKILRGQKRVRMVKSRNRYSEFVSIVTRRAKPYECTRPALPPGPEFVVFKEPGARSDAVSYPPPVDPPSPKCEFKATVEKPAEIEQPACGSIPDSLRTFLDSLQPYLAYARKRYPELFVATWLAIGCDLPATVWKRLEWQHVRDDAAGWELVGPLTDSGKTVRYKVAPRAVQELREFRRSAGKVFTKASYQIRQQIAEILGPNWRRCAEEIRKTL